MGSSCWMSIPEMVFLCLVDRRAIKRPCCSGLPKTSACLKQLLSCTLNRPPNSKQNCRASPTQKTSSKRNSQSMDASTEYSDVTAPIYHGGHTNRIPPHGNSPMGCNSTFVPLMIHVRTTTSSGGYPYPRTLDIPPPPSPGGYSSKGSPTQVRGNGHHVHS